MDDAPEEPREDTGSSESPQGVDLGVDLTLVRWMLSLTPLERLRALEETVWSILRLRGDAPDET